jgi:hypothetical protein
MPDKTVIRAWRPREDETSRYCKRANLIEEVESAFSPWTNKGYLLYRSDWRVRAVRPLKLHRFGRIHWRRRCSSGVQKLS